MHDSTALTTTVGAKPPVTENPSRFSPTQGGVPVSVRWSQDGRGDEGASALERCAGPRWLPAGDPRALPRLDAEAAARNAAGEDVQVVYRARGDRFLIVSRETAA
ncbi:hypothetical protein GCM10010129_00290 [Streptomyces fumigatiscleroticus]|nr:hypothetical protein GCM10010129_00290 [Streptomyces fumigatiscleroticus]